MRKGALQYCECKVLLRVRMCVVVPKASSGAAFTPRCQSGAGRGFRYDNAHTNAQEDFTFAILECSFAHLMKASIRQRARACLAQVLLVCIACAATGPAPAATADTN